MRATILLAIALVAACCCNGASAGDKRLRYAPGTAKDVPTAARAPYVDPAAPYKADRLSNGRRVLDVPGPTTVLTRDVLDDMNATSLRDALRSTAGVTVR